MVPAFSFSRAKFEQPLKQMTMMRGMQRVTPRRDESLSLALYCDASGRRYLRNMLLQNRWTIRTCVWPTRSETILLSLMSCEDVSLDSRPGCLSNIYIKPAQNPGYTSSRVFVFHSVVSIPIPSMTPQHSELAIRVLQDVSANIQRPPPESNLKLQIKVPSLYKGRECTLTNDAGDHVIRHQHFYQLTEVERHNYNTLIGLAGRVTSYVKYRENQGQKTKGNQDVWDHDREDLFFKGIVMLSIST